VCVDVASTSVRVLKEEDPVPANSWSSAEVSKLDPPAVKRPQARCVAFGAATELMSNATGGFDQEHQNDKEEKIARRDDREKGDGITEDANDGLRNDDEVNGKEKTFEECIEELKAFKEKHGHVRVTAKQDKSLAYFCRNMRCARRGKGSLTITEDRIRALDELGFAWGIKNALVEDRIEELKTFKAKHGHVRVPVKQDKSLANFCANMRSARRGKGSMTITEDRIKALDEIGFEWSPGT